MKMYNLLFSLILFVSGHSETIPETMPETMLETTHATVDTGKVCTDTSGQKNHTDRFLSIADSDAVKVVRQRLFPNLPQDSTVFNVHELTPERLNAIRVLHYAYVTAHVTQQSNTNHPIINYRNLRAQNSVPVFSALRQTARAPDAITTPIFSTLRQTVGAPQTQYIPIPQSSARNVIDASQSSI